MSIDAMRSFCETRVRDILAVAYPGTPIHYSNVPFRQPQQVHYVSIHILDGDGFAASLGTRYVERHPGVLQIDVLAPKDAGTKVQNEMAAAIARAFRQLQSSLGSEASVTFRIPSYRDLGEQGPWCVLAVSIPYHRDEKAEAATL